MVLGIGRGDSARRVMGKPPTTLARLEEATNLIRDLVEGRTVDQDGTDLHLTWTPRRQAARLDRRLRPQGARAHGDAIADGVILQLADPDLIRWFVGQLRGYARQHGRDPNEIKVMAAAPAHVGDLDMCRDRVRWFPALVSNHVVDLVNKYDPSDLPPGLTGYVRNREGYDYLHHAEVGSDNAEFVTDEVVDRFSRHRLGRRSHRQAEGAGRCRRRPVQHLPDERRRRGHARHLRARDHPGHERPRRDPRLGPSESPTRGINKAE